MTDTAIILAGGLGTRLRGLIGDMPKPLAPVQGRPFIAWQLDDLVAQGMKRIVLATGYRSDQFRAVLGETWCGVRLVHAAEPHPLGTGGAIAHASQYTEGEEAFVINGDTYLQLDLRNFSRRMHDCGAPAGMALAQVVDAARYGAVSAESGLVKQINEKGHAGPGLISAGWYWLSGTALRRLPEGATYSFEYAVLPLWIAAGDVAAYSETSGFIDIGVPTDYRMAQNLCFTGE